MKQRVISGAVLVVILAITLYFGGIVTCGLMALVSLVGNMELLRVYGVNKKTPGIVCYLATVLYYIAIYLDRMDIIVPMMVIYLLVMLAVYVLTFPTYSDKQIMAAFMDFFYVSVMLSFVYLIRNMEHGLVLVLLIFVSSWINDTCAYFVGRALGKHKMAPKLSPKKSIEGCIAGIVGAVIIALIYTYAINSIKGFEYSYIYITIFTIILSIIGQIGDFAASSIKRYADVKDFSNLIPGHGGMLDRIDSIIFIAPFAYILLNIIV